VAFESLAIDVTTLCMTDPILRWSRMWREAAMLLASVASDGGRVRGGMRCEGEGSRT
jgi:hypothetical protein